MQIDFYISQGGLGYQTRCVLLRVVEAEEKGWETFMGLGSHWFPIAVVTNYHRLKVA